MKLLVLGGTVFLGRHIVAAALAADHAVTVFNRGLSASAAPPGVEALHGDRDHDVTALAGRRFDAVIDCSGYTRAQAERSAGALAGGTGHYLFISTVSVYRRFPPGVTYDESAPVQDGDEGYGAGKARAEETLAALLPGRVTIVRPGLIVGPYDPTARFTYWPVRLHRGGHVLAPGRPRRMVQWIDARDLAAWCVGLAGQAPGRTLHGVGPRHAMADFLAAAARAIGSDAHWSWVDDAALLAAGVQPWTGLPLWIPENDPDAGGLMLADDRAARAAGLVTRSIEDTVGATLAWAIGPDAVASKAVATLGPDEERVLVAR